MDPKPILKVGDRVRIWQDPKTYGNKWGETGTITSIDLSVLQRDPRGNPYAVKCDGPGDYAERFGVGYFQEADLRPE